MAPLGVEYSKRKHMETQASQTTFRGYLLFWLGQLISLLGSSISQFVIVWWITLKTGSALYLSLSSLVGFAPMVVLMPIAGVLADRYNRKALIGIADFLQALATVALIVLFWLDIASIWYVLGVLAIRGILQAIHYPVAAAVPPSMIPRDRLSRMNGLNYLFSGLVNLAGPVVAAFLLEVWEIQQILWIDAITMAMALVPLLAITIPSVKRAEEGKAKQSFWDAFTEGLTFIRDTKGFAALVFTATALNFLFMPFATLLPYFVKFVHYGGAADLAFVSAFFQVGLLAGGLLMSIIKGFKRKMIAVLLGIFTMLVPYVIVAFVPTGMFWLIAICGAVTGFANPIVNVTLETLSQTVIPADRYGRVNSVMGSLANFASPAGMALSGATAELVGTSSLFLGCGLLGILVTAYSWFFTDLRHVEEAGPASQ